MQGRTAPTVIAALLSGIVATSVCSAPAAAQEPEFTVYGESMNAQTERVAFARAMDELQAAMIVVPSEVAYVPKFTYIWTLAVSRFPDAVRRRTARPAAVREIARSFLTGAGMTVPGELARVTALSRPEAGLGNRALVAEGFATTPARGVYVRAVPANG